ncbi:unnamed protein product [Durusdinium trenchii]|uniref:Cyclic nucleotide-binding domain-containing protein n=1 Tax=Durusdinium trenchii TaxID=1381693 RepID=A0ABP0LP01_9DINO
MLYCHEFINADVCLVCSTSTFKSQADILKIQEVCSLAVSKVTVVEQNAEPETNGMDYLFVTPPDGHTTLELMFDGRRISTLSGNAVFGQEVVFGVTKRFIFGSRVTAGSVNSLWVIPRKVVQKLLHAHRSDAQVLKLRAQEDIVSILKTYYSTPTRSVPIRLFDAHPAFKAALVEEVEIQILSAGCVICKEFELQDWALCVWRGEADVLDGSGESSFLRLSHAKGTPAWAAWWCLIELLGTQITPHISRHPVKAITDCIVWKLLPANLRRLQKSFPAECRMLEKVAMYHAQLLQPRAMLLHDMPFFHNSTASFLEALQTGSGRSILASGEVVYQKGKPSDTRDLYCVARGVVRVIQANVDSRRLAAAAGRQTRRQGVQDELLGEGAVFGENIALELKNTRAMSVVSETISDLYLIPGRCLCDALVQHPHEMTRFLNLLEERGYGVRFPEELSEIGRLSRFPFSFLERLKQICAPKAACSGTKLVEAGQQISTVYLIFRGKLSVVREDDLSPPMDIKAPTTVGTFAMTSQEARAETTILVNSFCGYFAVDVTKLRALLDEYPNLAAGWEDLVEEEQLDSQSMAESFSGRRASRVLILPEDLQAPDDDEERVIMDTLEKRFEGADDEFLDCLRDILEKRVFSEDEVILAQGDDGTFAILIASGCCTVEVNGTKVGEVQAGGLIGEAVLLGQASKRTATVRAVGQVVGFAIDQQEIGQIFMDFPEEKQRMLQLATLRTQTNKVLVGKDSKEDKATRSSTADRVSKASKDTARSSDREHISPRRLGSFLKGDRSDSHSRTSRSDRPRGSGRLDLLHRERSADSLGDSDSTSESSRTSPAGSKRSSIQKLPSDGHSEKRVTDLGLLLRGVRGEKPTTAPAAVGRQASRNALTPACRRWVAKRARRIQEAPIRAEARMALAGRLTPMIPKDRSYICVDGRPATHSSKFRTSRQLGLGGVTATEVQLNQATHLYGKPVWHESLK